MDYKRLCDISLFNGMNGDSIGKICKCIGVTECIYKKGDIMFRKGETSKGFLIGVDDDNYGTYIGELNMNMALPADITAAAKFTAVLMPFNKLVKCCGNRCAAHTSLIENFIGVISRKAEHLQLHNECLTQHTLRDKVLNYLSRFEPNGDGEIVVPVGRDGMARYFNVRRTSLSKELGVMKSEKVIDFYKNRFVIIGKSENI